FDGEVAEHVDVALETAGDAYVACTFDLALDGDIGRDQRFGLGLARRGCGCGCGCGTERGLYRRFGYGLGLRDTEARQVGGFGCCGGGGLDGFFPQAMGDSGSVRRRVSVPPKAV